MCYSEPWFVQNSFVEVGVLKELLVQTCENFLVGLKKLNECGKC